MSYAWNLDYIGLCILIKLLGPYRLELFESGDISIAFKDEKMFRSNLLQPINDRANKQSVCIKTIRQINANT